MHQHLQHRSSTVLTQTRFEFNGRFELLIFSEAGKPIYSYTKREDAVTLMPLCSALINYAKKAQKETLKSIRTSDNLIIHFTTRSPLIIIVIDEINSYVDYSVLVEQVESQFISIFTAKTLHSLFEDRPTFDLKRLLYGSEKLIDATTNLCAFPRELRWPWLESFLTGNSSNQINLSGTLLSTSNHANPAQQTRSHGILVPLAIISANLRDSVHHILQNVISTNSKSMVFSLLFKIETSKKTDTTTRKDSEELSTTTETTVASDSNSLNDSNNDNNKEEDKLDLDEAFDLKLLTICNHHERHKVEIADIHIILALLVGSRAQLNSVESLWMPICLPKFNKDAFLHVYIANINEGKHCLVLMSIDRDEFSNCQRAKSMIEERLDSLMKDSNQKNKFHHRLSSLVNPKLLCLQARLVNLRRCQSPEYEIAEVQQQVEAFKTKQELYHARQLQFLWYQTGRHVLWWQRSSHKSMNSTIIYVTKKMLQLSLKHLWLKLADDSTLLGWHAPTYQLYTQFDCTVTANEANEVIQKIMNWIRKEEDNFSIKDYR
jgi:hypothetical protein